MPAESMGSNVKQLSSSRRIAAFATAGALVLMQSMDAMAFPQDCTAGLTLNNGDKCQAPASTYKFTIQKFGFERDDGTIFYFGSPIEFDAASVNSGQTVANYLSGVSLPYGTYVAVRPIISISQTIAGGPFAVANVTCQQAATTQNRVDSGGHVCANAADYQCTDAGYWRVRDTSLGNMVISPTSTLTIKFDFDVSRASTTSTTQVCAAPPSVMPPTAPSAISSRRSRANSRAPDRPPRTSQMFSFCFT